MPGVPNRSSACRQFQTWATVDERTPGTLSYERAVALLRRSQHAIEKGLSVPTVKPGFGGSTRKVARLERLAVAAMKQGLSSDPVIRSVASVVQQYEAMHKRKGWRLPNAVARLSRVLCAPHVRRLVRCLKSKSTESTLKCPSVPTSG